jgi:hypothetical protein
MSKPLEFVLSPKSAEEFSTSIDRAIVLGAKADRLGYAFFGGYTSAITALDPSVTGIGALCATEEGGGHPRAIKTTLESGKLNGTKHFVSGGKLADTLLVVAKVGEKDGRPELKVARISTKAAGVAIEEGTPFDFVPEIPHGSVTFKDARVDAVLEGDGYERYLKPFRTIEDLHVFAAIISCLIANGRGVFPQSTTEQLLAVLAAVQTLGKEDPRSPTVHLALAGVLTWARSLIESLDSSMLDPEFRARFERDRPLLQIAQKAREARRVKAWASISSAPLPDPLPAPQGEGAK